MNCNKNTKDYKIWLSVKNEMRGNWIKKEDFCIQQIRSFLDPMDKTSLDRLCYVLNYLTGTGFRIGRIKSANIQKLRTEVSVAYKKKKYSTH